MKTTMIIKAILVAIAIFGASQSYAASGNDKEYFTNEIMNGDQLESKVVYHMENGLSPYMKYDYGYDDDSRITSVTVCIWDSRKDAWTNSHIITYSYAADKIVMEQATWNPRHKAFDKDVKHYEFDMTPENMPFAYTSR